MAVRVDSTKIIHWLGACALAAFLCGCGPALSEPSPLNLSGRWVSTDKLGALFNLEVTINQNPDGMLTGTWASDVSPPHPPCPPDISDRGTGTIGGINSVVGVQFALLGAGDFQGQIDDSDHFRGSLTTCSSILPVSFTRAPLVPAG